MVNNKSFCVLPWMHVASNSSGNLRLCCNSTPGKNVLLDDQGRPFKLSQSVGEWSRVYNSDWMKKIRQSMMSGHEVDICHRCYKEEKVGLKSARLAWNEKYLEKVEKEVLRTEKDGEAVFKPIYFDLRLGNLCNLKCRMCNPYASQKWLEDWNHLKSLQKITQEEQQRLASMDWFREEGFVDNLLKAIDSVEEIYFTGGEPLLIKKHFEILDAIIIRGRASDVSIKYNTNLTYLPPRIFDLWAQFKKVSVNISMDGVGAVNEYIRYPLDWNEFKKNILFLDQFATKKKNIACSIHTTVQLYNLEHLEELLSFNDALESFSQVPYLNILNHPTYLNIINAPKAFKDEFAESWRKRIARYEENQDSEFHITKLSGLLDYLFSSQGNELERFLIYTEELDSRRKESFSRICPRLYEALALENKFTESRL
jgi:sulfatase maturation enzyme AslB (radical SAM superfamily)